MTQSEAIRFFEQRTIHSLWVDEAETWFFSIVDVVEALTDSVKMTAADGAQHELMKRF